MLEWTLIKRPIMPVEIKFVFFYLIIQKFFFKRIFFLYGLLDEKFIHTTNVGDELFIYLLEKKKDGKTLIEQSMNKNCKFF